MKLPPWLPTVFCLSLGRYVLSPSLFLRCCSSHYFRQFGALAGIDVVPCDISLSGRVLAAFPEALKDNQRVPDNLAYLGELCKQVSVYRKRILRMDSPCTHLLFHLSPLLLLH